MVTITKGSQLYAKPATYELQDLLGGGRIALVYRAEQIWPPEKKGHQVAIKLARSAAENGRLEAEKTLLEKMRDAPGFPRLEGWGETREDPPRFFLVMEFIQGERVSSLAGRSPGGRIPEERGIEMALQYAQMLKALHQAGYASTDRKLDDIYWIQQSPQGPRLVVLDWNVAAKGDASIQAADLYQFGLFWYELLLGSPPPPLRERAFIGLESHPLWHTLTYGTRRILQRALHPMEKWRYTEAKELVQDLEFLAPLFQKDLTELEEIARREQKPEQRMIVLDIIRVYFSQSWSQWEPQFLEAEKSLQDRLENLIKEGRKDLEQGHYERARNRFNDARQEGVSPEQQLRIERWIRLASFAQSKLAFQEQVRALIDIAKCLDEKKWQEAAERFWEMLKGAFRPEGKTPIGFVRNCQEAHKAYLAGEDPSPYLQEANRELGEPWPSHAELFSAVVGLPPCEVETSLRFLADEAMLRTTLWQAINERKRGNLKGAADSYSRALFYFNAIPYRELLKPQVGDLQKEKETCERLASTLGEAKKDKEAGEGFLARGDFRQAKEAFEWGLSRFPAAEGLPEWAREMGEGLVHELRAGRRRAQLRLDLKEVLDLLEEATDSLLASPTTARPARKPKSPKETYPQAAEQSPGGEELLEIPLSRCRMLLDQFPDDEWGQNQYRGLKDRLVRQIEQVLESPQTSRIEHIAHLISLARKHFREELSGNLQDWELRATLVLRGEIDQLVVNAQKQLGEGWQAKLGEVLGEWQKGHELLRQIAYFQEVFDPQAVRAQEEKLDALYEQIKYLAQLQRDVAAEIGKQRARIDAEEQQRRENRRRAYFLAEEVRKSLEKTEPWRSDLETALAKAKEAAQLWPEGPQIADLLRQIEERLQKIDRQFSDALARAQEALESKRFDEARQGLAEMPPDHLLSEEQKGEKTTLEVAIEFEEGYSSAERYRSGSQYDQALEAFKAMPPDESLTLEQRERREELRLQIIREAHAQARKAMAEERYKEAKGTLGSLAGVEMPDDVKEQQAGLEDLTKRFEELTANLNRSEQNFSEISQDLAQPSPALERPKQHLLNLSEWIENAPEELPRSLKEKLEKRLSGIEEGLWQARKRLRFWQTGPLAEIARCLALAEMLKQRVEARGEFSSEEVSHEPSAETA